MCVVWTEESIHRSSRQRPGKLHPRTASPCGVLTELLSSVLHEPQMDSISPAAPPFQVVTNCKNTVQGFKRFHGRAISDPYIQAAKSSLVYDLAEMPSGSTGIKVGWTADVLKFAFSMRESQSQVSLTDGSEGCAFYCRHPH